MITQAEIRSLLTYNEATGVFSWLKKHRGCRKDLVAGSVNKKGYVTIIIAGVRYYAHRLAWLYITGEFPVVMIDHKNGDRADNRICNLRLCTMSQNANNSGMKPCNTSGYKGVSWSREKGKFYARCRALGKVCWLGYFETAESASAAYTNFASAAHGEFFNSGSAA
ncbi:HNH endonuclease [Glaciimonas sp. PCH181]|uniref:HNH endonuclease n=1 Tax=Glaciimonas sp. PCH181 TaxID=2133943 RepID=UPI001374A72B|nr:HNH endonuclease [Glaciimonas sp. PCH181]